MKLTVAEQKKLLKALPPHAKRTVKAHCRDCQMKGHGLGDILKSVGRILSPIIKELGPTALEHFIIPFLKKKISGNGLSLPGAGLTLPGQGLKLAGQGKRKPRKKKKA